MMEKIYIYILDENNQIMNAVQNNHIELRVNKSQENERILSCEIMTICEVIMTREIKSIINKRQT